MTNRTRRAATTPDDDRFDRALYTVSEAARMLSVPSGTFRSWAKGYRRRGPKRDVIGRPILTLVPDGDRSVPFIGLAEGMVLAAIRSAGVPLQRIRPALDVLQTELGVAHALASESLYTDGAEVLFDYAESSAEDRESVHGLVVVRSGQSVFRPVVQDYLRRITYAVDGYAAVVRLPEYRSESVLADPGRSFGSAIFEHGAARVDDVLDRFWAGETLAELAEDFGVPIADLEDAVRVASRRAA